ncbi:putative Bacterial Ig-like, group 2 [Vibrio owensii]|uniref:Ig-like domain-containing protein n=1 Tax=Vibrio owensii TaxID=696485 RepID=UPI0003A039C0|nr:Ig-like domain-containing protein [Vibrio owensii]SUP41338.1 putative Bacterial Ig-like, group 2 [Vibrio owensii]
MSTFVSVNYTILRWALAFITLFLLSACNSNNEISVKLLINGMHGEANLYAGQEVPVEVISFNNETGAELSIPLSDVELDYQNDAFEINIETSTLVAKNKTEQPITVVAKFNSINSNPVSVYVSVPTISSLKLTPFELTLPVNFKERMIPTVTYSNGLSRELTSEEVSWHISDDSVVSIVGNEIIGKNVGFTTVTIEYEGESAQTEVTITDAILESIVIANKSDNRPLPLVIESAIGVSTEIITLGIFSDGQNRVLEDTIYQIDGTSIESEGSVFKTVEEGISYVTAQYQNITSPTVMVAASDDKVASLFIVTPDAGHHNMLVDRPMQLTAQATWGEAIEFEVTDLVEWEVVEGHEVVNVSSDGVVSGLKVGEAVVQASLNSNLLAVTSIVVRDSALSQLTISPENATLAISENTKYEVRAHFDDGESILLPFEHYSLTADNPNLVSVYQNTITALEEGKVVVTATLKSAPQHKVSASLDILYKKASAVILALDREVISIGEGTELRATVKYIDGTEKLLDNNNISWHSSDINVAAVVNGYIIASGEIGTTDITATYQDIVSFPIQLKVEERQLDSINISVDDLTLSVGSYKTLAVLATYNGSEDSVDNRNIIWSSSDPTIATVNNGVVTAKAMGVADIEATFTHDAVTKKTTIRVNVVPLITDVQISTDISSLVEGETQALISLLKVGSLGEQIPIQQEDRVTWVSEGSVSFDENSMTVIGNSAGDGTLQALYTTSTGEIRSNILAFTVASAPEIEVEGGALRNIEIMADAGTVAMHGRTANFKAIGVYSVDNVTVNRDISNLVDWSTSGAIKPSPNNIAGEFYFDKEGDASLIIRYGGFAHSMGMVVSSQVPVNSRTVEIGGKAVRDGQTVKLPGKGVIDLNVRLHFEDGSSAQDTSIVWGISPQHSSALLVGSQLNIQEANISFTLSGYNTNIVGDEIEVDVTPIISFDVEVGDVDVNLTNVELQLERASYKLGDKLQYTLYKNYDSGLRDKVTDLSSVTIFGDMLDSNSLGEASITKVISGGVYAKLNDIDEVSNSVEIEVTSDKVESLTITAQNSDLDNYLVTDNGYQFNIYSQVDNGLSEPCMTCTIVVSDANGELLGANYYSVEVTNSSSSAKVGFFQPATYYVKAVSSNGLVSSEIVEVTVPNNPISSIELNIEPSISTVLGSFIKPDVTVHYTDGQTRKAGSVTYTSTASDLIDIQGDMLYPLESGSADLTAHYKGLSDTKNVLLQVEESVTVQSTTIHFPRVNSIGELVLDAYHKPYITMALSNGTNIRYSYEDVSWTIKSSELPYEQTLQGFRFFYEEEYDGEYAYTEFVGSIYFNGELYQTEKRIGVDSRITSGLWISKMDWNKVDEIRVGESVELTIRRGFYQTGSIYYDFLVGTKAAPSNNNVKILSESGYKLTLQGVSAGPVTVYVYSQYGEFLDSEDFNIVE